MHMHSRILLLLLIIVLPYTIDAVRYYAWVNACYYYYTCYYCDWRYYNCNVYYNPASYNSFSTAALFYTAFGVNPVGKVKKRPTKEEKVKSKNVRLVRNARNGVLIVVLNDGKEVDLRALDKRPLTNITEGFAQMDLPAPADIVA